MIRSMLSPGCPGIDDPFRVHVTSVGSNGRFVLVAVLRNHRDEALRGEQHQLIAVTPMR